MLLPIFIIYNSAFDPLQKISFQFRYYLFFELLSSYQHFKLQTKNYQPQMKKYFYLLIFILPLLFAAKLSPRKIFLVGDSTVTNYRASDYPMTGWGQVLQKFINSGNFTVDNRAIGGRSSRSFIEEGRWDQVKSAMSSGDFVMIQFGHNDRDWSKAERFTAPDDYKNYLKQYVNEARALGAIPVLVTPMVLNAWRNGALRNVFTESGAEYVQRMKSVAQELNVPLIDLNQKSWEYVNNVGVDYDTRFVFNTYLAGEYPNYPNGLNDYTHFQEMGALQMAKFVVEGIQQLSTHNDVKSIFEALLPQYKVIFKSNKTGAGTITRTDTYPDGVTITLKALTNSGHTFLYWKDINNTIISRNSLHTVPMSAFPTEYTAVFDNDVSADCAGVNGGSAMLDSCGICTGGTTGRTSCTGMIQAESLCEIQGVSNEATNAGFIGAGYANTDNVLGSNATWSFVAANTESTVATIRFANGGTDPRNMTLVVNEVEIGEVQFPATGSFSSWSSVDVTLPLHVGGNKIELVSTTSAGGPNLDLFAFRNGVIQLGTCTSDCNNEFGGTASIDDCGVCSGGNTGILKNETCIDCNGDIDGIAVLDDCEICSGGNTNHVACTDELQAEQACEIDGVILETINSGFLKEGYANTNNVLDASISFHLNYTQNTNLQLEMRYANGGATNRDGEVFVNGISVGNVMLPSTGNWTTWHMASVQVPLEVGYNHIEIKATSADGLGNIDVFTWANTAVSNESCLITAIDSALRGYVYSATVFESIFEISSSTSFDYKLFNVAGALIEKGENNTVVSIGENLLPNIYHLVLTSSNSIQTIKIIKQ